MYELLLWILAGFGLLTLVAIVWIAVALVERASNDRKNDEER